MAIYSSFKTFKTVAKMKAATGFVTDILYYVSEVNKTGFWEYDATDTTTAENTGLVIVTTTGSLRLKRKVFNSFITKNWFSGSNFYFDSVADANTLIPIISRKQGMMLFINEGGTIIREYWYRQGTADLDLVPFAETLFVTNGPTTFDREAIASAPTSDTIFFKSIGVDGTGGISVSKTSTPTTVQYTIDGSALVLFSSGPLSARPAGVRGENYYQEDQLEGRYSHDGFNWEYYPGSNTLVWERFMGLTPLHYTPMTTLTGLSTNDSGSFGRWLLQTGIDPAATARVRLNATYSNFGVTGKIIFYSERIQFGTLSDGTNRYIARVGRDSGADANGIWFEYSDNINAGKWQCVNYNGTRTVSDSGVVVAANVPYTFCVVYDFTGADNIKFYINNVQVGSTHTTNLPTDFTNGWFGSMSLEKTLGTTNRTMYLGTSIIKRIM